MGRLGGFGLCGRWEGGSGWGTHVNPWLIHVNVWQNPLQHCKVINLQLIKINGKKRYHGRRSSWILLFVPGDLWEVAFLVCLLCLPLDLGWQVEIILSWNIGPADPSCFCFRDIMQRRFQIVVCILQFRHTQVYAKDVNNPSTKWSYRQWELSRTYSHSF